MTKYYFSYYPNSIILLVAELGGVKRGFIPGHIILEGVIFVVYNLLLTTSLIFLTLLVIMCLRLNKYDCMLIIRKQL
jgi:hypothetical protein